MGLTQQLKGKRMEQLRENISIHDSGTYDSRESLSKGRILIVDDDVNVVSAVHAYLSACGYTAVGCTSGKEAIERLKTDDFELVLTDLMMPEMNGVELLKAARGIDPHLIGIILTGKGTLQTTMEMMKEVSFLCSLKPFNFKMMQLIISCAIKARRLGKLEDRYHELAGNTLEPKDSHEQTAREREAIQVKTEIEHLKDELRCYEYLEKHWKQMM